ncbi:MAG TPA: hypothetical protein PLD10_18125, partial [Rhodopila sp.]|nr:hypothetical protein [Rhodopila sp.]
MTQTTFGIIGAGGFGREVLPAARAQYLSADNTSAHRIVFVSEADDVGTTRNGIPVVGLHEFLATPGVRRFNTAIADSVARARIASVCEAAGVGPFTIQA